MLDFINKSIGKLFGNKSQKDIKEIQPIVEKILAAGVDAVDLNVGCPAKNVVRSGGGSSLMADPAKLKLILLH